MKTTEQIKAEVLGYLTKTSNHLFTIGDTEHKVLLDRRGGPHTDGNYLYGWGGNGGGWLTGEDGRFLPREKHINQYCSDKGGMLIISSYEACKGWNGEYDGEPNQGGDCSHLDLSTMESFIMEKNTLYWGNSTFIHESLPIDEDVKRQLVRITLPADAEDLV